jgi:hypothetical protein
MPAIPLTVRRIAVSPAERALGSGDAAVDYEVAFRLDNPDRGELRPAPAEDWLRNMFEMAPRSMRWFLIVGWLGLSCRLHLGPSPAAILGWRIESTSTDRSVIAVHAWIGFTSRLVLTLDGHGVTVASFVAYTRQRKGAAPALWAMTAPLHERLLPYLLGQAARRQIAPAGPG